MAEQWRLLLQVAFTEASTRQVPSLPYREGWSQGRMAAVSSKLAPNPQALALAAVCEHPQGAAQGL